MRVFVAGATGVIGQFLVPGLVSAGHEVTGTTARRGGSVVNPDKLQHLGPTSDLYLRPSADLP